MAKGSAVSRMINFVAWLTGVIVSLAVGFSLTAGGALNKSIPWLSGLANGVVVAVAGWIVVVLTILGIVLAIFGNR